jgi:hypothetical protein
LSPAWALIAAAEKSCTARKLGTDVMILKIFSQKNLAKKLVLFAQNKAKF